jgi:release factor glutamine methyltransferase
MKETPATLVRRIAAMLREAFAGDDRAGNADLDARLLVGHALGLDATGLVVQAGRVVTAEETARTMAFAARRAKGEPVARITGTKGFWTLDLMLSPETLVPRPDTETVVSAALERVKRAGRTDTPLAVLDLGTGSGAILLALLAELPGAWGIGVDRSEGAARTARGNAIRHGLEDRARFVVGDWGTALSGRFDLVVGNPPYIRHAEIASLAVDVRHFDPDMALDGGADGLDAYRAILNDLDALLTADGAAFLEVGARQADDVAAMAELGGFRAGRHRDLSGIERVVEIEARQGVAPKNELGNRQRKG